MGSKVLTYNPDCTIASVEILDAGDAPVPGAVEVACPQGSDCCDPASLCGILNALPVQAPGGGDTALFVGPGGCFLGVPAGGGALACPYEAPCDGACATPAYSFATDPSSGVWYGTIGDGPTSVNLSFGDCTSWVAASATDVYVNAPAITLNATTFDIRISAPDFVRLTAGGGADFQIDSGGEWQLNGDAGTLGQVLTSQGPGTQPIWAAAGAADVCAAIEAFDPITPATAIMRIPVFIPGDNLCATITVQDVCDFCGGGAVTFPLLADDGTCTDPSYSFTNDTTSGMFLDPGNSLSLGWNDCDSGIDIGSIITIYASNGDFIEVGASINLATTGELQINGSPGTAGQVLTSNGPGVPATWQAGGGGATFPLLAPDGNCAAPSYSFTTDSTSGVFFDPASQIQSGGPAVVIGWDACNSRVDVGTSVRIGADNGDFIEVGAAAGITVQANLSATAPSPVTIRAGSGSAPAIVGADLTMSAGGATTGAGGAVTIDAGARTFGGTGGQVALGGVLATGEGGTVDVRGGFGFGALPGGRVTIRGGTSGSGTPGAVEILTGSPSASRLIVGGDGTWDIGGSVGAAGEVVTSQGPGLPAVWAAAPGVVGAQLVWATNNISSGADTRVIPAGYDNAAINTQTPKGYNAPRAGTFRNLFVRYNTANGNGASADYTLRVNGVLTALTVSLATGAIGSASNLVSSVAVAQGDLIEMVVTKAVSIGSGVLEVFVSAEFA